MPDGDHGHWIQSLDRLSKMGGCHSHPRSRCTGWSGEQREYLQDMLRQVKAGKQAGKTVEEVITSVNLSRHGGLGSSASGNATSIKAMYRRL